MASTRTRTTRVAHTDKPPARCPHCHSTHVTRKGTRKKKIEIVQLWRCASCKRVFTPTPAALRDKTYPLHIVLDAITLYNLGYSLEQTADKIKSRFGRRAGRSTIAAWLAEHASLITYSRLRAECRRLFPPTQAIRSIKLYHRQIYKYEYHRAKLAMLREDREHRRFAGVADFLERVPTDCPNDLFRDSERASQKAASFLDTSHLVIVEKENFATRMAALVIPTVGDNRLRHEALQHFMLANDSTTLAIEVPIWLGPDDIAALEAEHGITLLPPDIRERRSGAVPQDFELIGTEFHRWVRNNENSLGLTTSAEFARFIERDFAFYGRWYQRLRRAAETQTKGLGCVHFNAQHNFTLQYPVLLAPLQVEDDDATALRKLRVVAAYLDILIHRCLWNWRAIDYSTMQYSMFLVMAFRRIWPEIFSTHAESIECLRGPA